MVELYNRAPRDLILALCVLFPSILYLLRRALLPKPIPGIPYNESAAKSLLGDIHEFRTAPNRREWLARQAVKHQSPLVQLFMRPFARPWVFVADYFEASDICMRRLKEFDRADIMREQFGGLVPGHHITLKSSDPQFKKNKELVRDLMSVSFLQQATAPQMHEKFSTLLKLWNRKLHLSHGQPFDVVNDIHNAALDIILGASFGIESDQGQLSRQLVQLKSNSVHGGQDDAFEFEPVPLDDELGCFTILADSASVAIKSPAPVIHHFLYRNLVPKMRRARAGRNRLRDREVAKSIERRRLGRAQRCALDNMLAREDVLAEKEGRKPDYRSQTIMSELLGYLVAGHETTSAVLRWGTKYLTTHQRVQALLRESIWKAFPDAKTQGRVPMVEEILKASNPYLDAVVEEMLRHSRSVPITFRQAITDTEILGQHIPKGTTIGFFANGPGIMMPKIPVNSEKRSDATRAHMRKTDLIDDADISEFCPERWLTTKTTETGDEEIVFDFGKCPAQAFGIGPRGCFGKKLAYMEIRIFLTLLFWEFKLDPIKPELATDDEMISLTRTPKHVFVKLAKLREYD
ncbi:cytochrome P450 monooxygenase 1A1 [Fusarium heterosporum]|uniref:Cytochrome P450 monooxygenase 1A1 n=1 Tax=Fusarium heterosporum TaxID=42747 RepID=A0A8H5ST75_FUSHE|nr:cytochrome P450 monooxygenase 1A1 [Fusarium heterosporum]